MKKKLLTLLTLLVAVCSGAWADETLFLWKYDGTTTFGDGNNGEFTMNAAVTGTAKFVTYEAKKTSAEGTIGYANTVTDSDLKPNITNGCKLGNNGAHIKCSPASGNFQAGDIIYICGYNPVLITTGKASPASTNDIRNEGVLSSSLALGTAKGSYAVGSFTLPSTFTEGDVIYISRSSSSVGIAAIKIVRPAEDNRTAVTLSFASESGSLDINSSSPALPTLTSDPDETAITGNITYSSSNTSVATVNASTGALTLVGIGKTTITADFAGNTDYKSASATYTLTVTDATKLGYAEVINEAEKTLDARWLFGINHTTVSQTFADFYSSANNGGIINEANVSATLYLNGTGDTNKYTSKDSWRKNGNGYTYTDNDYTREQWVGYNIVVDDNYVLSLSHIDARIMVADDTYKWYVQILDENDNELYKSAEQTTKKSNTAELSAVLSLSNLNGTIKVKMWVTQNGSTKRFSIEKLILTGATAVDTRDTYTISYAAGEGTGVAPSDEDVREGDSYKVAKPYFLAKDGKTFTGWVSGENTYTAGQIFTPAADMTLTAQFEDNQASLSASTAATTVLWDFQKGNTTEFNLASGTFVTQATINGKTVDMPLAFDKQIRNNGWTDWAIVTNGTKMTIPAVKGMTLTMLTYENPIDPTRTMTTIAGEDLTSENVTGTANPYTVTYTYDGSASTIDIVFNAGYIRTLAVAYPKTLAAKPTMAAGTFNFEDKIMPVTITAADGETLYVSNGSEFAVQTSPYEANVTAGVTCSAKTSLDGGTTFSEVASYSNEFDASKKYVAWAFESSYSGYAFADDPMATELKSIYNVIPVNAYTEDMENADLIVLTEAVDGKGTFAKSMKGFVGSTPMINLKFFAYTKGTGNSDRWNWGAPSNNTGKYTITPESALYKVLDGVTFESDGSVKLYDNSPSGNVIQTVDWDVDPTDFPASNVDMGMTSDKVSMHASDKFFGLGLSCDNKANYSANALTIIKNAAAMLIAGEDLTTEIATVSGTITDSNYNTFSSSYALDLSTISGGTAYVATSVTDGKVVLSKSTAVVPAGTGLMIAGSANDVFTIETTEAASTLTADNLLVGMPNGGEVEVAATGYNYVFGWTDASNPGFYKVTADKPTLPAGKAYLHTTEALSTYSPARLAIAFEDESTGIAEMQAVKSIENGKFYNLNGQQVAQPTKGLYIVNGKKVMVK